MAKAIVKASQEMAFHHSSPSRKPPEPVPAAQPPPVAPTAVPTLNSHLNGGHRTKPARKLIENIEINGMSIDFDVSQFLDTIKLKK